MTTHTVTLATVESRAKKATTETDRCTLRQQHRHTATLTEVFLSLGPVLVLLGVTGERRCAGYIVAEDIRHPAIEHYDAMKMKDR